MVAPRPIELYRPAQKYTIGPVALITCFALGFMRLTGESADEGNNRNFVESIATQARHEMGDDASTPVDDDYCYNFNLTGLKAEDGKPYTTLGTHEIVLVSEAKEYIKSGVAQEAKFPHKAPKGKVAVYFRNLGPALSHRATHFRHFETLEEGCLASLRKYLVAGSRYAKSDITGAMFKRDMRAFAYALKAQGYFTADPGEYAGALSSQLARVDVSSKKVDWPSFVVSYGDQLFARLLSDA